jgi:hypothetical protein
MFERILLASGGHDSWKAAPLVLREGVGEPVEQAAAVTSVFGRRPSSSREGLRRIRSRGAKKT